MSKDLNVSKSASGIESALARRKMRLEPGRWVLLASDSPSESITKPLSRSKAGETRPEALASPAQRTGATQTVKS